MKRNIVIDSSIEPELREYAIRVATGYENRIGLVPNPLVYRGELILSHGDKNIYVKKVKSK